MSSLTVSVVGLGYIGLPTAAVLARAGCRVVGVEINPDTVATINEGRIHIVEAGLGEVVADVVRSGHLRATTTPEPAEAFLIAVPTPFHADHQPDLRFVRSACDAIAPVLRKGDTVILESTSPVGATEQIAEWIGAARPDLKMPDPGRPDEAGDIAIAYCPERVLPGNVLHELVRNDRVIGGLSLHCSDRAKAIYAHFVEGQCILTNARTAEMCKLTENSFRDVNIAFANELSLICDRLGIDVWELVRLANHHPRVQILQPGPGVGGHCIACDPWFIVASAPQEARIIRTAREVNDSKPEWVIAKVADAIDAFARAHPDTRPLVACYGLAFKPNIDDLRDSPALMIARRIAAAKACDLLVVEPNVDSLPSGLDGARLVRPEDAARADVHVLLVDHAEFKQLLPPEGTRIDTRGMGW